MRNISICTYQQPKRAVDKAIVEIYKDDPSLMEFPTAGLWKLDAYIDEELFGSIVDMRLNKFIPLGLLSQSFFVQK